MEYTVKSGDTLTKIARKHGTTNAVLLSSNPKIKDPSRIRVGQSLRIPDPIVQPKTGGSSRPSSDRSVPGPAGLTDIITARFSEALQAIAEFFEDAAMKFDRKQFFVSYRAEFGKLKQQQVTGLEQLLAFIESDADVQEIRVVAYMLATVKHETADTFHPVTEYGAQSYFNRYDPVLADTAGRRERAKAHGNTVEGDGYKYRGRGYVQITWKNNYKTLGDLIGTNLVNEPDKAVEPEIAYKIMSLGMRDGLFTDKTHKIGDYVGAEKSDYFNARQVINGHDEADTIKGYAEKFEKILRASVNP